MLGLGVGFYRLGGNDYIGSTWLPSEIGSLIHWYQFNTGITTTVISSTGKQIQSWDDQKGSNNLAPIDLDDGGSVDVDESPKLDDDGSVLFNQADDNLGFSSQLRLGAFSIYARVSSSNFNDIFMESSDESEFIKLHSTTEIRVQPGGSRKDITVSGLSTNTKFTFGIERDGEGQFYAFINGTGQDTEGITEDTSNTLNLNRIGTPLQQMNIYEILIFSDVLTSANRTLVNAYLDAL
tara:strand:- start:316 stop:1026 length:711 start_codon:yes stop_codon:yes gene_type:complete